MLLSGRASPWRCYRQQRRSGPCATLRLPTIWLEAGRTEYGDREYGDSTSPPFASGHTAPFIPWTEFAWGLSRLKDDAAGVAAARSRRRRDP